MRKLIYGLLVAAMAVGLSAFTTSKKSVGNALQTRVLAWDQALGEYRLVQGYDPGNCIPGSETCAYETDVPVGTGPGEVPNSFPIQELDDYESDLDPVGSEDSQYIFQ